MTIIQYEQVTVVLCPIEVLVGRTDFESIRKDKKPFPFFKYIIHLFEQQVKSMKQVNNESTRLKHQDTYDDVF